MEHDGQSTREREYATTVLQIAADDVRQMNVRVTGAVGIAALALTQLPFDRIVKLQEWARWMLVLGIVSELAAAALFFYYLGKVHLGRLAMARAVRDGKAGTIDEIWAGGGQLWSRYGWAFQIGTVLMGLGVVFLAVAVAALLDLIG